MAKQSKRMILIIALAAAAVVCVILLHGKEKPTEESAMEEIPVLDNQAENHQAEERQGEKEQSEEIDAGDVSLSEAAEPIPPVTDEAGADSANEGIEAEGLPSIPDFEQYWQGELELPDDELN